MNLLFRNYSGEVQFSSTNQTETQIRIHFLVGQKKNTQSASVSNLFHESSAKRTHLIYSSIQTDNGEMESVVITRVLLLINLLIVSWVLYFMQHQGL